VFFEFLFYEVCSIIFCGVFQGDFAASFFDCERVLFFVQLGRPPLFGSKYAVRCGFRFGCFCSLLIHFNVMSFDSLERDVHHSPSRLF
jgi:hypothetical protein